MATEYFYGRRLTPEELEHIRRQVEGFGTITAIDDEVRGIIERNWPDLAAKLPPKGPLH
jgi:hypothetical protein